MRRIVLLLVAAMSADAGVIRTKVLERASGLTLRQGRARLLTLKGEPIRMDPARPFDVPPGRYYVVADAPGYVSGSYGSSRPGGLGKPIEVTANSSHFIELQLARKAIVSGTVYDENGIGIPGVEVVAYAARLPLRVAGRATTDDRGEYHIGGLDEGRYYTRTSAFEYKDHTGLLPLFSSDATEPFGATKYFARYDKTTRGADIRPYHGKLFRIRGTPLCGPTPELVPLVTVRLASELGSREAQGLCGQPYEFTGIAPAAYDIYAEREADLLAGAIELALDKDTDGLNIPMGAPSQVRFVVSPPLSVTVEARRADPSGAGKWITNPTALPAGRWELRVTPPVGMHVSFINRPTSINRPNSNIIRISQDLVRVTIALGRASASISGTILEGRKPVETAPVFLWSSGVEVGRFYTGADGKYKFDNLPAGDYVVMSTYDCVDPTQSLIDEYNQPPITLTGNQSRVFDTTVWNAP